MPVKIQIRNGTAAEWTTANPVLLLGEMGIENDTTKMKVGNGVTAWNSLSYMVSGLEGPPGSDGAPGADGAPGTVPPEGYPGRLLVVQSGASYPDYPTLYKEFLGSATPPSTGLLSGDIWTQAGGSSTCTKYADISSTDTTIATSHTFTMPAEATSGRFCFFAITVPTSLSSGAGVATCTIGARTLTPAETYIWASGFTLHVYAFIADGSTASATVTWSYTPGTATRFVVSGGVYSGITNATPVYSSKSSVTSSSAHVSPTISSCAIGTVEFSVAAGADSTSPYTGSSSLSAGPAKAGEAFYTAAQPGQWVGVAAVTTPLASIGSIGNRTWSGIGTDANANTDLGATWTLGFAIAGGAAARFIYDGSSWATGSGL